MGPVFEPRYIEVPLSAATAPLAAGCPAVCGFVHDKFDAAALDVLVAAGCKLVALRCAGFNNVDLAAAARLGVTVVRVPAYSPHAVAEHTSWRWSSPSTATSTAPGTACARATSRSTG